MAAWSQSDAQLPLGAFDYLTLRNTRGTLPHMREAWHVTSYTSNNGADYWVQLSPARVCYSGVECVEETNAAVATLSAIEELEGAPRTNVDGLIRQLEQLATVWQLWHSNSADAL